MRAPSAYFEMPQSVAAARRLVERFRVRCYACGRKARVRKDDKGTYFTCSNCGDAGVTIMRYEAV